MTAQVTSLEQSVHEILSRSKDRLGDLFYRDFLEHYPELQPYFSKLDLHVQATMLMNALHLVVAHAGNRHAATTEYLKILGYRHHQQQIPLDAFPKFIDSMLAALARFHGPEWSVELARAWRSAFEEATAAMQAGYRERSMTY
jgi:hemoglobin-like flavoprotein